MLNLDRGARIIALYWAFDRLADGVAKLSPAEQELLREHAALMRRWFLSGRPAKKNRLEKVLGLSSRPRSPETAQVILRAHFRLDCDQRKRSGSSSN